MRDRDVRDAVEIEVAGGNGVGRERRRHADRSAERAVAAAQQQRDVRAAVVADDEIEAAVPVEIGGRQRVRKLTGRIRDWISERSVAVAEQNADAAAGIIRNCEVDVAIAVEIGGEDERRIASHSVRIRQLERAVAASAEQHHRRASVAGKGEIRAAVAVEIGGRDRDGHAALREHRLRDRGRRARSVSRIAVVTRGDGTCADADRAGRQGRGGGCERRVAEGCRPVEERHTPGRGLGRDRGRYHVVLSDRRGVGARRERHDSRLERRRRVTRAGENRVAGVNGERGR